MRILYRSMISLVLLLMTSSLLFSQEPVKKKVFNIVADLMSRYYWRGTCLSKNPNIQPTIYYEAPFGLKAGAWGSYDFSGNYAEADLFLAYAYKGASLTINDYFVMNEGLGNNRYFVYDNESTGHQFEVQLAYDGPEKFPLHVLAGTIVYGADKKQDEMLIDTVSMDTTITYKNQYSTYIELGYTIRNFSLVVGFTPMEGMYGNTLGVINLGLTARKEIRITDKFSLPCQASVFMNPQKHNIHLVFGITL